MISMPASENNPLNEAEPAGFINRTHRAGGSTSTLRLEVIEGPRLDPFTLPNPGTAVLGRSVKCELKTPEHELSISREHCRFQIDPAGRVTVRDLTSRHGTHINNVRLNENEDAPLSPGDQLKIGPWTLRLVSSIADARAVTGAVAPLQDVSPSHESLFTLGDAPRETIHRRRLELLLDVAKRTQTVRTELELASVVVQTLKEATGFSVVAFVRPDLPHNEIHVLEVLSDSHRTDTIVFSRSLIRAASGGQAVKLRRGTDSLAHTHSLVGVQTCMCVPVMQNGVMTHALYLDCREGHMRIQDDAAAFCQAVADVCALTLSSMRKSELEVQRAVMTEQMSTALQIQQTILPPTRGRVLSAAYCLHVEPGRYVAGDLFEIFPLDDRRVALFMGDVSGKGVPAAMMGAMTQSYLTAALHNTADLALSLNALNRHLASKMPDNAFVSMFAALLDVHTGVLTYVDAGHGYWVVRESTGELRQPAVETDAGQGLPLRVEPSIPYQPAELILSRGSRLIVFSDGVTEQRQTRTPDSSKVGPPPSTPLPPTPSPGTGSTIDPHDEFGRRRVLESLAPSRSIEQDVELLLSAVRRFAGGGIDPGQIDLSDDLTIASVQRE
ncbi:MAG: SpoIIE family protein phosphatase [Phycisphaerales bacterium]|nr:SpoIIE family protein phosphatase [Phycisphaerales bacterium]